MSVSKSWVHSWSALEAHELCPKKCYHEKVAKDIPFKETTSTVWGNSVHKALEISVGEGRPLGDRFKMYQNLVDSLRAKEGQIYTERMLGITKELTSIGFFEPGVYYRGKSDITIVNGSKGFVGDYKTGKKKPGGKDLKAMAVLTFINFPEIQELFTAFIWLSTTPISLTTEVFKREDIDKLWSGVEESIKDFEYSLENNMWTARQNFLCKNWCDVETCVFNGKRRT